MTCAGGRRVVCRGLTKQADGKNLLGKPGLNGMILKRIYKKQYEGLNRIDVVQNEDSWQAVVIAVMKLSRVS